MFYTVKTPWWLKALYPGCTWEMPVEGNRIYLSFDDGPHPEATPFVLDELARFNAKATFFCIGKNVATHPRLFERILAEGHTAGNHTFRHVNGWKCSNDAYFSEISEAAALINSTLFRPPYGRIRPSQARHIKNKFHMRPVMWSLLSGDFDPRISREKCLGNVVENMRPGHIVVFHDSAKAYEKLRYTLPLVLGEIHKRGWIAEKM